MPPDRQEEDPESSPEAHFDNIHTSRHQEAGFTDYSAGGRQGFDFATSLPRHNRTHISDFLPFALIYAQMGLEVFELCPGGKFPRHRSPHDDLVERAECKGRCGELGHGFYDATNDLEVVEQWWSVRPNSNIGIRPAPGLIVLDVDSIHGHGNDGWGAMRSLQCQHGSLPATATAITPTCGLHMLFWAGVDGPYKKAIAPGVDIKSRNGFFVAVPSWVAYRQDCYWWLEPEDVAYLPPWARKLIVKPPPKPRLPRTWYSWLPGAGRGLVQAVARAEVGNRNPTLYWAACRAAEDGLLTGQDDPIYAEFEQAAIGAGLDCDEISRTMRSAIAAASTREGDSDGI